MKPLSKITNLISRLRSPRPEKPSALNGRSRHRVVRFDTEALTAAVRRQLKNQFFQRTRKNTRGLPLGLSRQTNDKDFRRVCRETDARREKLQRPEKEARRVVNKRRSCSAMRSMVQIMERRETRLKNLLAG